MRSIWKKGSVTLVVVLALCAIAAASASASQFYVGGKALSGTAKLSSTVKVEEPIVFKTEVSKGVTMVITCKSLSIIKSSEDELEAPGTAIFAVKYESCSVSGVGAECRMEESISSRIYKVSFATGTAPENIATIGTVNEKRDWLGPFVLVNGGCEGPTSFYGSLPVKMSKGQTEAVEQQFVGEGTAGKGLELVGWGSPNPPVYMTGKFKVKLESGQAWSYR